MIDHFTLLAPVYDRLIGPPDAEKLRKILDIRSDSRVLDVGGGTGRVAAMLDGAASGVVVVDISHSMLKQSRHKNKLLPVQSSVHRLPFADDSVDRILVVDAMHHIEHPGAAIREMVRILRPGGRLVIEDFDIRKFVVRLMAMGEKLLLMNSRFFRPEEIEKMAEAAGAVAHTLPKGNHAFFSVIEKPAS